MYMILCIIRQKLKHSQSTARLSGRLNFGQRLGRAALDNPDLPIDFVRDLLLARAEGKTQAAPFIPEGKRE